MRISKEHPHLMRFLSDKAVAHEEITPSQSIAWRCSRGHDYLKAVRDFERGEGCYFCSSHRVWPVSEEEKANSLNGIAVESSLRNDLWHTAPEVAKRLLHPEIGFFVTRSSLEKALFACAEGHMLMHRIREVPQECLKCSGKVFDHSLSLEKAKHPLVALLRDRRDARVLAATNGIHAEFVCPKGHVYSQPVSLKIRANLGCTLCFRESERHKEKISDGKALFLVTLEEKEKSYRGGLPDERRNDLWATHPTLAMKLLDPHLGFFRTVKSNASVDFKCEKGHVFNETLKRHVDNFTCPFCSGLATDASASNSIKYLQPKMAEALMDRSANILPENSPSFVHTLCCRCQMTEHKRIRQLTKNSDCPSCIRSAKSSKLELEIARFIRDELGFKDIKIRSRAILKTKELDIYLPSIDLAIEVNGDYWHSDKVTKDVLKMSALERHKLKDSLCTQNGVRLIFIWEFQWKIFNERTREALRNYLISSDHSKVPDEFRILELPDRLEAVYKKSKSLSRAS